MTDAVSCLATALFGNDHQRRALTRLREEADGWNDDERQRFASFAQSMHWIRVDTDREPLDDDLLLQLYHYHRTTPHYFVYDRRGVISSLNTTAIQEGVARGDEAAVRLGMAMFSQLRALCGFA